MSFGSVLAFFALPALSPAARARQMDQSVQDVATFLQDARLESVRRNAPVICRAETRGHHTVLTLDWNLTRQGPHPGGQSLTLPRGVVVLPDELRQSGIIAVFNPRGGYRFGPQGSPAVLLWRTGTPNNDRREIEMTSGDLKVMDTRLAGDRPPAE
jgi:hypothetical protein